MGSPALAIVLLAACDRAAPPPPAPPPTPVPVPLPADAPVATISDAGRPTVTVEFGLDLRALPTNVARDPGHVDLYVLSEGDRVRGFAPAGSDVEIRHMPGWGVLYAVFRAPTLADARAACEHTVAAYMADPPRMPLLPPKGKADPAASVAAPCHEGLPP